MRRSLSFTVEGVGEFRVWASPTPREQMQIEMLMHDYAGGLVKYNDMQQGIHGLRVAVEAHLAAIVWPDGAPAVPDGEEAEYAARRRKAVDAAYAHPDNQNNDTHALRALLDMESRLQFMAVSAVLLQEPAEWQSIADRPDVDLAKLQAVIAAYFDALARDTLGKTPASTT